ncbi:MAG: HAD-IA family hydrolase [Nitrospiraceae bacterium]|nr:HAD-IA family hydrolase [Nitrospiraceae bacterium]
MIRLIMFDLDGTLVDTALDLTNALNYAIEPYDIPELTVARTISLVGEGVSKLVARVVKGYDPLIYDAVLDRFTGYYAEHLTDASLPYPGVAETLQGLEGRKKAVVSNKREAMSKRLLADLGLLDYFDLVLGSDSVDENKPSPKPLLHAIGALSSLPEESVMVGDSDFDILAGRSAGVKTVAVSYGFRPVESLRDADFIIGSMAELPALLFRLDAEES